MQKYHIQSLSQRCLTWLRNHRVPLSHFGLRTTVDHDAFLGRFPGHSDINVAFPPRDHPQTPNAAAEEAKTATDVSSEPPTAALPKTKPSRKQSKDQLVWEDVARVDLGTPLLSNKDLLHHLRHRGEWSTCRVSVRIAWQNKQRVQAEVRCLESAACPCEGYLTVHTDEAGACLCPAFANGGSTDPSRFIELQLFLNAAHGGSFSFSTQIDRQKVLKPKPTNPAAPVPEPVGMTLKETNVHFIFLQQQMFFANWWALVAANKPLGLVQRCLFSFGARLNVGKQTWNAFSQDIAMPVIERLFAALIRRFGPRMTSVEQAVFHTTGCQRAVLVELEEIGRLFARKDSVSSVLREAMPKAMYWLGTSMMTNHLAQHLWPAALGGPLPDDVPCM